MKLTKRIFALLLCALLMAAVLPVQSMALTEGDWEFTLQNGEAILTKYIGTASDVVVPATIKGAKVVRIEENAAKGNKTIKHLEIPGSIKEIGSNAFSSYLTASALETVVIKEGVEKIDNGAFAYTKNLVSANVPHSVTSLGTRVFAECSALTDVDFQANVTAIPAQTFYECRSLTHFDIPEWVTQIDGLAFAYTGLTSIVIPAKMEVLNHSFHSCADLKSVEFKGTTLKTIGDDCFHGCTSLTDIILPVSVTKIGSQAFCDCTALKGLALPYGAEKLGNEAFYGCSSMEWLSVPSTVSSHMYTNSYINQSPNAIIYCPEGSKMAENCQRLKVSFLYDSSADSPIQVIYNGDRISFGAYGQDPTIVNSRTLVPLRSIFEAMGASVDWNDGTKTVTAVRGATKIVMTIGQTSYTVNGVSKTMDVPPQIMSSRTMVPIRVIAESFGADVGWNSPGRTVLINE
ncbi:MAG: leucine-rich repeat protein [Oscillospiraceae bacterium]|nr:leucine-rich repeat protein [Oscillospiraceae bacterium]